MNLRSSAKKPRYTIKHKIRSKSGSEWTEHELNFFCIEIEHVTEFKSFFGSETELPYLSTNNDIDEFLKTDLSSVDFIRNIEWKQITSTIVRRVIKDIIAVTKTHMFEESAVDDLAKSILQLFDYDYDDRAIRTREPLDLNMSNIRTKANPDVCIEDSKTSVKLLVQEDKSYNSGSNRNFNMQNAEAQLIAEAIAASQANIVLWKSYPDLISYKETIAGIVLLGTCPTFYLIPVSEELSKHVMKGTKPSFNTIVRKYMIPNIPPVNRPDAILSRNYAPQIVECLKYFRKYV